MKWIKCSDKLPPIDIDVLVWGQLGHVFDHNIASLYDQNGKNGYTEWVGAGGFITRSPNKEFPNNMKWCFRGHYREFNKVTHWCELPYSPDKDA